MPNRSSKKSGEQSKRGFATMPKEKTKEIARKGGKHSHGAGKSSEGKGA